jgi:hypothetical protein
MLETFSRSATYRSYFRFRIIPSPVLPSDVLFIYKSFVQLGPQEQANLMVGTAPNLSG